MTGSPHPRLSGELTRAHAAELLADAERHRLRSSAAFPRRWGPHRMFARLRRRDRPPAAAERVVLDVRIRYAGRGDSPAIRRLAALDCARVLEPPMLLAEVDGELLAAMSLWDGRAIADPFHKTQALVELLAIRAGQIHTAGEALLEIREGAARIGPGHGSARRGAPRSQDGLGGTI